MELKDIIYNRRRQLGLTLEQVGNACGVAKATVQRWESGNITNLKRDKIAALAKVLQTTPAVILGWEELPEPSVNDEILNLLEGLSDENKKKAIEYFKFLLSTQSDN